MRWINIFNRVIIISFTSLSEIDSMCSEGHPIDFLWQTLFVRDRSLITGWGVKLFVPPHLKGGNFCTLIIMAKTSSFHVETTSKLVVPPLQHG